MRALLGVLRSNPGRRQLSMQLALQCCILSFGKNHAPERRKRQATTVAETLECSLPIRSLAFAQAGPPCDVYSRGGATSSTSPVELAGRNCTTPWRLIMLTQPPLRKRPRGCPDWVKQTWSTCTF